MENGLIGIIREAKVSGKIVFNILQQMRYSRADQEFTESDEKMSEKERRNSKERHRRLNEDKETRQNRWQKASSNQSSVI